MTAIGGPHRRRATLVTAVFVVTAVFGVTVVFGTILSNVGVAAEAPLPGSPPPQSVPAPAPGGDPAAGGDAASRQARGAAAAKAFLQGRYDEALAAYLDLYVQSGGRPEYLRNIGRCQQKLNQYDHAIESFKEYLRRAKKLNAGERAEVQGFIAEMEAARAAPVSGGAPSATAPSGQPPPPSPAPLSPVASPAVEPLAPAQPPAIHDGASGVATPSPSPSPSPPWESVPAAAQPVAPPAAAPLLPMHEPPPARGWSGLRVGAVVVIAAAVTLAAGGTLALIGARSRFDDAKTAGCPSAMGCDAKADSVSSAILVSRLLYVGAGIAGAAGLTMFLLAPSSGSDARIGLGLRSTF